MEGKENWKKIKRKERGSKRMQDGLRERKGRVCRAEGEREMERDERKKEKRTRRG